MRVALSGQKDQHGDTPRAIASSLTVFSVILMNLPIGLAIMLFSMLSFLGFGIPPPTPCWAADLALSRDHMETAPWLTLGPAVAIFLSVLGFFLFGSSLREALDSIETAVGEQKTRNQG